MNAIDVIHLMMIGMHMQLTHLASFVDVATTGSFTEAALARDVSQSAISHAISALERELGVTLIERNRTGVIALTAVGERVLVHARAMLAHGDAIAQEAIAALGRDSGKLRVGNIRSFVSPRLLAGYLATFRRQHPDIEVTLFEGTMKEVAGWLDDRTIDVGFVMFPAEGVDATRIAADELVLVTREDVTVPATISRDHLLSQDLVMEDAACVMHVIRRAGWPTSTRTPRVRYQASNTETILEMVREGIGVSILPRTMVPETPLGLTVQRFDPPLQVEIGLAVRSTTSASWAARQFIAAVASWSWLR